MGCALGQELADYARDGAAVIRNALDADWIDRMRAAIARLARERPGATIWMARYDAAFAAFVREAGLGAIAGALLGVDQVHLFYDQLLVKTPTSNQPTPLHHDLPYWPITGAQMISIWVPFDQVALNNGAVQYLRGSHLSERLFHPDPTSREHAARADLRDLACYEEITDPDALIADNEIIWWETAPGDVIAHHPLTLHFAGPNRSAYRSRRAMVLRFAGPSGHFIDLPGSFTHWADRPAHWPPPAPPGAPLDAPDYPVVWRAP